MRALLVLALAATWMATPAAAVAKAPANLVPPSIVANPRGSAYVNQTLAAIPGKWTATTAISVQWDDCDTAGANCSPIPGATGRSYALQASDAGHTVRVHEVARNGADVSAPVTSAATVVVTEAPGLFVQLINEAPPTISGTAERGGTLVATSGSWTGTAPLAFKYQWLRCWAYCLPIHGATGPTRTITRADARATTYGRKTVLSVRVTATNSLGSRYVYVNPGTAVDGPREKPRNVIQALDGVCQLIGPASTIPQLLKNNGYRTAYYPRRAGRVDATWALHEDGKPLAAWHGNFHRKRWVSVKIRLTPYGRRLLAHHRKLTIASQAHVTYPPGPHGEVRGGTGLGEFFTLSRTAPAEQV